MRKSRFNHQFCTKTCFNHQYCTKINYFFIIQWFIYGFVAYTYTKGQLACLTSPWTWLATLGGSSLLSPQLLILLLLLANSLKAQALRCNTVLIWTQAHCRVTFSAERNITSSFEPTKILNYYNIMSNILQFGHDNEHCFCSSKSQNEDQKRNLRGQNDFGGD